MSSVIKVKDKMEDWKQQKTSDNVGVNAGS